MQRRSDPPYPVDGSPFGYLQCLAPGDHDPLVGLLLPADVPPEIYPPAVNAVGLLCEPESIVRYFKLGGPPVLEYARPDVPDCVPCDVIYVPVLREDTVTLDPRDIGDEDERSLAVVVGIDHDAESVGFRRPVSPRELADNPLRVGIVTDHANVHCAVIVQHPDRGDFCGEGSFFGVELCKIENGSGQLPLRVVDPTVNDGRVIDTNRVYHLRCVRGEHRECEHTCRYQQRERCPRHT